MPSVPIILTVDDEPQVLNAVERDLRRHFRRDYRIVKASSGAEALDAVEQLKARNDQVALFLSDQRMPDMSGTEFLTAAAKFYPSARKVLLTAYADTQAAIDSINTIGLDHYLMKPWDPPDQNLYPVLDDLLEDWAATIDVPYDGIRVAGTLWSASSHVVKDFLSRNQVPYRWLDIEKDSEAKVLVEAANKNGHVRLPVVFLTDGKTLLAPTQSELAAAIGMHTRATESFYDLIIVGAGPAGLGAAVYGGSEGLRVAMIERAAPGGQAGTSSLIENYLGFPRGLTGADLARRASAQARRFGVEMLTPQEVISIQVDDPYRSVELTDGTKLSAHALVIAPGMSVRRLDVPGAEKLAGVGVYYGAALAEAANYRDQHVVVVGGANSAGQGAMFFARYARNVTMLVRGDSLQKSMSQYLVDQIADTDNIEVLLHTEVAEVIGETHLEAITLRKNPGSETETIPAAAVFIFIRTMPHTDVVAGVVERDEKGFIITGEDLFREGRRPKGWKLKRAPMLLETSVPGIFAGGDARYGSLARVASAVGQGAMAVSFVHEYLKTV